MSNLNELFLDELADIYNAEQQLLKALPKMAKAAQSEELKAAFEDHLSQTEEHVRRLEQVFESLEKPAKGKKCEAMEGLIKEGKSIMEESFEGSTMDAALICAAQKVEHYEIATYGCLCTWAELLEHEDALDLLKETLDEEKETDEHLTEIAESTINAEAADGQEDDEEEPSEEAQQNAGARKNKPLTKR